MATLTQELMGLLAELKRDVPFFSGRYKGHMVGEQTIASQIGYFATMLYNPNNIALEISPVTTRLEVEVAAQLACMIGYDPSRSWGHLTSGGTIANFEALWLARGVRYLAVAAAGAAAELGIELPVRLPGRHCGTDRRASALAAAQRHQRRHARPVGSPLGGGSSSRGAARPRESFARHHRLPGVQPPPRDGLRRPASRGRGAGLRDGSLLLGKDRPGPGNRFQSARACPARPVLSHGSGRPLAAGEWAGATAAADTRLGERLRNHRGERGGSAGPGARGAGAGRAGVGRHLPRAFRRLLRRLRGRGHPPGGWDPAYRRRDPGVGRGRLAYRGLGAGGRGAGPGGLGDVDPHKMGYVPYSAGAILVRDGRTRHLVATDPPYLSPVERPTARGPSAFSAGTSSKARSRARRRRRSGSATRCSRWTSVGTATSSSAPWPGARRFHAALATTDLSPFRAVMLPVPDINIVCYLISHPSLTTLRAVNDFNERVYTPDEPGRGATARPSTSSPGRGCGVRRTMARSTRPGGAGSRNRWMNGRRAGRRGWSCCARRSWTRSSRRPAAAGSRRRIRPCAPARRPPPRSEGSAARPAGSVGRMALVAHPLAHVAPHQLRRCATSSLITAAMAATFWFPPPGSCGPRDCRAVDRASPSPPSSMDCLPSWSSRSTGLSRPGGRLLCVDHRRAADQSDHPGKNS